MGRKQNKTKQTNKQTNKKHLGEKKKACDNDYVCSGKCTERDEAVLLTMIVTGSHKAEDDMNCLRTEQPLMTSI